MDTLKVHKYGRWNNGKMERKETDTTSGPNIPYKLKA